MHTSNEINTISVFAMSLFQGIEPLEPIERQNTKVYNKPQKWNEEYSLTHTVRAVVVYSDQNATKV